MKPLLSFFILLLLSTPMFSQDCNSYYILKEGEVREYTSYDKKGNEQGVSRNEIIYVEQSGDVIDAEMEISMTFKKGKPMEPRTLKVSCEDGIYTADLNEMLSPEMLGAMGRNNPDEIEMSGSALSFPKNLQVGDELADADISFSFGPINGRIDIYNRKVTDQKDITTKAGTFPCYKMEYDMKVKMIVGKLMGVVEYYSDGIGMVKQETYNAKGKLIGSSELTKFESN